MARMGASDVLLYENPYPDPNTYYPTGNPRRHRRHHRRNPSPMKMITKSFAGLDLMEMAAAVGGFALSAMVPGYILKPAAGGTLSTWQKAGKVGIAVGFAVLAKVALNRVKPGVANAAMYGGIAGAGALALKEYTTIQPINSMRRIAATRVNPVMPASTPAASMGRSSEQEFMPANQL